MSNGRGDDKHAAYAYPAYGGMSVAHGPGSKMAPLLSASEFSAAIKLTIFPASANNHSSTPVGAGRCRMRIL